MGQKSNPIGLRLQINRTWDSRWYAEGRNYAQLLKEDIALRKYIIETLPQASISGLRISTMLSFTSLSVILASWPRSFSISAPFLPMITPGRAA